MGAYSSQSCEKEYSSGWFVSCLLQFFRDHCSCSVGLFPVVEGAEQVWFIARVLWRVWFLRNQLVQGVGWHGLENVVPWSEEFLEEFMVFNGVVGIQREQVRQNEIKWHPPEVGFFKLNTYAAIDVQKWCVGLGMVVRDHFGAVKAYSTQRIEARYSASVAEALAILRGISFAIYCGYDHLVIESDALGVVNMINSGTEISTDIGVIIGDIRCLIQNIPDARVKYVSRKANVVAHSLSKLTLTLFPPAVERCVQDDCPG
ncbi:hypothetical protein Dsin_001899 [Dipteronia sinensis]|uniref:RNase H type-1 domain-containing protein n=1 Tax=Dipteronia sinensis TaxID=43782 RepID=A0AAE0EIR7_9ROSI|nr:hypothetical protein Dsin_001899 [Dipteronia sinensis]